MQNPEQQSFRAWKSEKPPERILLIRFHAIGDVAITFPWSRGLRRLFPSSQIDFLTSTVTVPLARGLHIFDHIFGIPQEKTSWHRLLRASQTILNIRKHHYDLVIDLQRNWVSRYIRHALQPTSWGEFNRYAQVSAGQRVEEVFQRLGFTGIQPAYERICTEQLQARAKKILITQGWDENENLIVLNPAGLWTTRQWPMEHYVRLAQLWQAHSPTRFLFLGTGRIREKASFFQMKFPASTINLVDKTTLEEAFAVLQCTTAIVSEDSGLMHMAWVSGIPTLTLFGSTNHIWSTPLGGHSTCLHSGDLPCGACMQPNCVFGDVHCLTRYTPEQVFNTLQALLSRTKEEARIR